MLTQQAAWDELEKWGVHRGDHPKHREAQILIFSTNRRVKWWEHIQNGTSYFEKKYEVTIASWNKKLIKQHKMHQKQRSKDSKSNSNSSSISNISNINNITIRQLYVLESYVVNVFFQKKTLTP